jgi:hypothetical protein
MDAHGNSLHKDVEETSGDVLATLKRQSSISGPTTSTSATSMQIVPVVRRSTVL